MDALGERFDACFRDVLCASPSVRRLAGVDQLNRIGIEVPAWYLWLRERPGVFMLECIGMGELGWGGGVSRAGNFAIRYFPMPGIAPIVVTKTECVLRRSRVFEEKGIPRSEYVELIRRRNYFSAGEISVIFPPRGGGLFHIKEDDRSGSGAELFDVLIRMFSFHLRSAPALWTTGTGWQAISFPPMSHPHGGEGKVLLPIWRDLARLDSQPETTPLWGCGC